MLQTLGMPVLAIDRRGELYRQRTAELARSANREVNTDRRRHLLDLA